LKKIYLYPISARNDKIVSFNPYTFDFVDYIGEYYEVVNKNNPSGKGILNILWYLFKIDYVFLNWIENLPEKKAGTFQSLFFLTLVFFFRLTRVKIVWIMHNKLSHNKDHLFLKKIIFNTLISHADFIISHSNEGISYAGSIKPGSEKRTHYFPHPVKDRRMETNEEKQFDILIWGTLSPYKGILEFLRLLHEKDLQNKYTILVIGISTSKEYYDSLLQYTNDNITLKDDFLSDDILRSLINQSKIVLFTYAKSSILSSGVLMDSIGFGATVVGPYVGAFADLSKEGIISTYHDTVDLFAVIDGLIAKQENYDTPQIEDFLKANSWEEFAKNIHQLLNY
jgi:glycosyltransferase involved in cell wall biosynthesis